MPTNGCIYPWFWFIIMRFLLSFDARVMTDCHWLSLLLSFLSAPLPHYRPVLRPFHYSWPELWHLHWPKFFVPVLIKRTFKSGTVSVPQLIWVYMWGQWASGTHPLGKWGTRCTWVCGSIYLMNKCHIRVSWCQGRTWTHYGRNQVCLPFPSAPLSTLQS